MNQRAAMQETLEVLKEHGMNLQHIDPKECSFEHLTSMYNRVREADHREEPFSETKIGRWLGYIQGVGIASQFLTLEQAKEINKKHA